MHISYKYIFQRLQKKYKEQNLKGVFLTLINFLNTKINPKYVGELPFKYLFLKKRQTIKKFIRENLDKLDDVNIVTIGNYLLNKNLINSESIVYSFGVGDSISFEKGIVSNFNCKVLCFDPTTLAKNYMSKIDYDKNLISFMEYGIWDKDEKVKFFYQDENKRDNTGGSILNQFKTSSYVILQCYKLKTLMKQNNHSNIDILKLDIEGAANQVLKNVVDENILPKQIVAEFEYSDDDNIDKKDFDNWLLDVKNLIKRFRDNNYKIYYIPRYTHLPYSTIEVLMQKIN